MENGSYIPNRIYFLLLGLLAVVYLLAMFIPVMEVDAAQYASISEQMLRENSFLQVKHRDYEYLDKPPLLFWLSALSMKVLGINGFAYKLPSVLALGLAIFATYKYTRLHHREQVARVASLILASCFCFFLTANDVRTDNLLIGFSMLAIWKIAAWLKNKRRTDLLVGFGAIGMAMLAKGPLGLVFTMFTIGTLLVLGKEYKKLSWEWLWALPVIGLVLAPMCLGLYQQHGMEGLEFFFWKQSFGRITGENEWRNDTDPFFLVHTFLCAFLPWCILLLSATGMAIKKLFRKGTCISF
jgi:4-amino-4-deoxy-L-arabinose transferase-like glycosyltransferase